MTRKCQNRRKKKGKSTECVVQMFSIVYSTLMCWCVIFALQSPRKWTLVLFCEICFTVSEYKARVLHCVSLALYWTSFTLFGTCWWFERHLLNQPVTPGSGLVPAETSWSHGAVCLYGVWLWGIHTCECDFMLKVGFVELCAKILQIIRNDFKDYAHTFCQLCTRYVHLYRLCIITHIWQLTSTVRHYIWWISQTCYFHLRRLSSTTQTWCHCQTGYCFCTCPSWLLQHHPCGSPGVQSTLVPLQWVFHVAIHTVLNLKPHDHVLCTTWTPLASCHCEDTV